MAKVAIQDVLDAGFRKEQFGTPADFETASTGYLARVIADAEVWSRSAVGDSAYDAATGGSPGEFRLKRAELCFVKAELWRRRAAFLDSNAQSALEGGNGTYLERREFKVHAEQADICAQYWLTQFLTGGTAAAAGSGVAMGHVESTRFSEEAS